MPRRSLRQLLVLLMVPVFLGGLDTTLFNSVTSDLPVLDGAWRLWFIDSYAVTLAATVVLGSRLGARYGPGRTLTAGLVLFACSSAVPALAHTIPAWVSSRCLEGAGYALMISSVVSCVGLLFDGEQRTRAYSCWAVTSSLGAGLGPLFGRSVLIMHAYPWLFWGPAILAMICGTATAVRLRDVRAGDSATSDVDMSSAALAFTGFALLIGALQGEAVPFLKVVAAALGVLVLIAFGRRQKHSADPLTDVEMLRPSTVGRYPFSIVLSYAAYTGAVYCFGSSSRTWGALLAVSLLALWVAVGGFLFPYLQRRSKPARLLGAGFGFCAVGLLLGAVTNLWIGGPFLGTGVGVTSTAAAAYLLNEADSADIARAGALQETSFAAGSALGVATFGGVLGLTRSLLITCTVTAVLLLLAGLLPQLTHRQSGTTNEVI